MNVEAGTRLGPYEVISRLGAGGMGEVWRARDTRLDRDVALKILSPAMAKDAQLRLRLDREGKTISQLSHPHICALFDVGDGYLVMELLEGETLADRLSKGPLPMSEVLRLGEQIAHALHAAHRRGIVHRDLKPGNIMLTRSGAKLLDFGLARARASAPVDSNAETQQQQTITEEGAIVGTLQYMAPEQLDGKDADPRTDIFALGAVMYEMATGKRAFGGPSRSSVITAIATADPPSMSRLQPLAPLRLEQLVRGCMAKEPDERIQSAHDVAMDLRWIANDDGQTNASPRAIGRARIAWIIAALLGLVLAAALFDRLRQRPEETTRIRFNVNPPAESVISRTAAISPDGKRLAYRATGVDGRGKLWLHSLDSGTAMELEGTDGAVFVFWSPDSRHIGFFARGKLRRLDTADGTIRTIYESTDDVVGGATWSRDDVIVFSPKVDGGLYRIAASGGEAVPLAGKDQPIHAWPSFLPDGRHFLYTASGKDNRGGIMAGSLDSAETKILVPFQRLYDITPAHYGAGHLFYLRKGALVAQAFDPKTQQLSGAPVPVDERIEVSGPGRTPLSVSERGTLVYRKAGGVMLSTFSIVDRTGRKIRTLTEPSPYGGVSISPDGQRLLASRQDAEESVWSIDLQRGSSSRVTFEDGSFVPVWFRDGKSFAYSGSTDSPPNVYLHRADGSTARLTRAREPHYVSSVSPDGAHVVYTTAASARNWDVYSVTTAAPHVSTPLLKTEFGETDAVVSPDGRWLAYTSNESGRFQVYVTQFPKAAGRWQVSTAIGDNPQWSADGREIYYSDHNDLYTVNVSADGDELRAGVPEKLFELPSDLWAVFPNGNFLTAERTINTASPPLSVIVNWRP